MTLQQAARVAPTDHKGLRVLTLDECLRRLGESPVGRLAFHLDGEIAVLPVNHTLAGTDVCFRILGGSRIKVAVDLAPVSFEVVPYDESARAGWSVLVRGTAVIVSDPADVRRLEGMAREPWAPGDPSETTWIRVRAQAITGRSLDRV